MEVEEENEEDEEKNKKVRFDKGLWATEEVELYWVVSGQWAHRM